MANNPNNRLLLFVAAGCFFIAALLAFAVFKGGPSATGFAFAGLGFWALSRAL